MNRKTASTLLLTLLTVGVVLSTINTQPVWAGEPILIHPDGHVDPPAPIMRIDDDTYAFTDNIYDPIIVGRDHIVVDGAGHSLLGNGSGVGIDLSGRSYVTIKNITIKSFGVGISLNVSTYNLVSGNTITDNQYGIELAYSSNNTMYHNNFISNEVHAVVAGEYPNRWDDGYPLGGNYWSTHFCTGNPSGGDYPYVIDESNVDVFPFQDRSGWLPPTIHLLSPQSTTYTTGTILLSFSVSKATSWIGYSLNSQAPVTIEGDTTLRGLADEHYSIVVSARDESGNTGYSNTIYFIVDTTPPIADAGWEQTKDEDTVVTLDGTGSMDNVEIASYSWTFLDETMQTLTGATVTYIFTTPGVYMITLNVSDRAGHWDTDTVKITIQEVTTPALALPIILAVVGVSGLALGITFFKIRGARPPPHGEPTPPSTRGFVDYLITVAGTTHFIKMQSTSTVSEVRYDSTRNEIVFTVTGPDQTQGATKVIIPQVLAVSEDRIRVYLDDFLVPRSVTTTTATMWQIHFTYRHSSHTIRITTQAIRRDDEASFINFTFTDVTERRRPRDLHLHEGFLVDHRYWLTVSLDLSPDRRYMGEGPQPERERPEAEGKVDLYVAIFPEDPALISVVGTPLDTLEWSSEGPSQKNARFTLEVRATNDKRASKLYVFVYYKKNILYTAKITITIQPTDHRWVPSAGYPIYWHDPADGKVPPLKPAYKFPALADRKERGLSIAVHCSSQQNEYLLTAFIGETVLPARVTMTADELSGYMLEMQRLMDDLRKQSLYVEGGFNRQGQYVGDYIGDLDGYNQAQQRLKGTRGLRCEVFNNFLKRMVRLGSRFYDELFKTPSGRILRQAIEDELQEGAIIQIWIDRDASDFIYPWTWLYPEPIDPSQRFSVHPERFWGYQYIIEQLPQFDETLDLEPPTITIPYEDNLDLRIGVWNFEPFTRHQKDFFATCTTNSGGMLTYDVWDEDQTWEQFLPQCDSHILYFFSHGHTAKPPSLASQLFYDMEAALKAWAATHDPDESDEMKRYRHRLTIYLAELEDSDLLSETFIKLTHGYLLLRELRSMDLTQSHPLVFLNMCESAQIFPTISEGLIDVFLKNGARGVIGTEIPMIPSFADLFSRTFFEAVFYHRDDAGNPMSVGEVLLDLRRKFLSMGNPLGFAYTLFGDATTRLSKSLPSALRNNVSPEV